MDENRGEISSESNPDGRTVKTKVPEVEIHVFRKGEGPIKIFKACLGGWDQDRLELRAILKEFGFESVFKYDPASGRGDRIYFNPDNGKSLTSYSDGSVVFLDGDPKAGPDVQVEKQSGVSEIEETSKPTKKYVTTKVPEVEIHLFRQGKGPIDVFKSSLGGWDQDLLEVRDILDKYGFKSIFAFNPESGRSVPICFNPKNGRSILPYEDGAVIFIDGEPKTYN
ncbi:hypothetical protein RJ641_031735 [Dillenia turbinata]|uniref:Uncharacterized protein n=1 Tax=Dillenia turbinata TaxID=194707 RepID=A0AAN8VYS4_9MAGN